MDPSERPAAGSVIMPVDTPEVDARPIQAQLRGLAAARAAGAAFRAHRAEARDRCVAELAARLRGTADEFLRATAGGRRHALKSRLLKTVLGMLRA
jgi:acyl-CoA reductase-like NAD-dependent aldehyde dehydrogenase